jgi:hypothetical protein
MRFRSALAVALTICGCASDVEIDYDPCLMSGAACWIADAGRVDVGTCINSVCCPPVTIDPVSGLPVGKDCGQ